MSVTIRFQEGAREGDVQEFGDDVEIIAIGRDPDTCQVVLPADLTVVGREHCALRRVLGRYRLQLNRDNLVLVGGEEGRDGQELADVTSLQLGPGGPKLVIETARRGDLGATVSQGVRLDNATLLQEAAQTAKAGRDTARKTRRLVLAAVVLVGVAGFFLWRELGQTQEQLGQAEQQASLDQRLRTAMANAKPSVYLVLRKLPNGDVLAGGTAWVVGQDVLATNAHVAEMFHNLAEGEKMIARSPGTEPRDFVVRRVRAHPGFEAFFSLWRRMQPAYLYGSGSKSVDAPGPACDVALLYVEDPSKLAPPLPLAPPAERAKLREGLPVGTVGYSMEGLSAISYAHPSPFTKIGRVDRVTNYFGQEAVDAEGHAIGNLVQHGLPTAGGASGSPILNEHGQVLAVHNAGNYLTQMRTARGKIRIGATAAVNFAQRVDLLIELLEGQADQNLPARIRRWEKELTENYGMGSEAEVRRAIKPVLESWEQWWLDRHRKQLTVFTPFPTFTDRQPLASAAEGREPAATFRVKVAKPGPYLVIAAADREGGPVTLTVTQRGGTNDGKEHKSKPLSRGITWGRQVGLELPGKTTLEVVARGGKSGREIECHVYAATAKTVTVQEFRDKTRDEFRKLLRSNGVLGLKLKLVYSATRTTAGRSADPSSRPTEAFKLVEPGFCRIFAVAHKKERLTMKVFEGEPTGRRTRTIRGPSACPSYDTSFKQPVPLQVEVHSTGGRLVTYSLFAYQTVVEKPAP